MPWVPVDARVVALVLFAQSLPLKWNTHRPSEQGKADSDAGQPRHVSKAWDCGPSEEVASGVSVRAIHGVRPRFVGSAGVGPAIGSALAGAGGSGSGFFQPVAEDRLGMCRRPAVR